MANYLLVHGAWGGAWYWRPVQHALIRAGHNAHAVTLTGLGERAHLLSAVDQQREGKRMLRPEAGMALRALRVNAENGDALRLSFRPVVAQRAELLRADAGVVAGIPHQDHRAAA